MICAIQSRFFKDKEERVFLIQAGVVGNKLYKISYYSKSGGVGGYEGLLFVKSFNLLNPPPLYRSSDVFDCSYEIVFPGEPTREAKLSVDGGFKIVKAFYNTEKAVNLDEIVFDEDILLSPDDFTTIPSSPQNKQGSEADKEVGAYYEVNEYKFTNVADGEPLDPDSLYLVYQEQILRDLGAKLLSYNDINYGSYKGKALEIRDLEEKVHLCRMFLVDSSLYIIRVKLKQMISEPNDRVKAFFNSFRVVE